MLICAVLGAACGGGLRVQAPARLHRDRASVGDQCQHVQRRVPGGLAARPPRSWLARSPASSRARQVANPVAEALHTTPAWVGAHVSGTPVPTSPFVTISANASSPAVAKTGGQRCAEGGRPSTPQPPQRVVGRTGDAGQDPRRTPSRSARRRSSRTSQGPGGSTGLSRPRRWGRRRPPPRPGLAEADRRRRPPTSPRPRRSSPARSPRTPSRLRISSARGRRSRPAQAVIATNDRKQVAADRDPAWVCWSARSSASPPPWRSRRDPRARPESPWPVGSPGCRRRWR